MEAWARNPAPKIRTIDAWLREYCESYRATYLDYYGALTDADGWMRSDTSLDGVHPNASGCAIKAPLAQAAIDKALAK